MTPRRASLLLFFLSGSVLVLEILAARLLAPYVGLSLETYTAIIGVVLAGISAGHALGGRVADRFPWRRTLGAVVIVAGISSAAVVPVVSAFGTQLDATITAAVVLAFVGFFVPTSALSVASPIVTKAQLRSPDTAGRVVGSLSAWSTAGALAGTFLTGFVLVTTFPTTRIIYGLSTVLTALGVALLGLPRRRKTFLILAALAGGVLATATTRPSCEVETRYYCTTIRSAQDDPAGRILQLDTLSHSYVDLDDPDRLGFRYQRAAAAVLDASFGPVRALDVLHVGGGGFAFPRYVTATRPGSSNRVFELDPDLAALASKRLDLDLRDVTVVEGDARTAIAASGAQSVDAVVADAFGSLDPPWHLATVEAATGVRRMLRKEGIYIIDVVDSGPLRFARSETATLLQVFPHVRVLRAPLRERPANTLVIGSERPIHLSLAPDAGRLLSEGETRAFAAGALVLRDDYAPVHDLITRQR